MAMKCCTKLETAKERCPIVFQGHPSNFKVTRNKTSLILTQIGHFRTIGQSQLSNPSDLPCFLWYLSWNCPQMNVTWPHWWLVNIEIWWWLVAFRSLYHHMALLGQNGLILLKFTAILCAAIQSESTLKKNCTWIISRAPFVDDLDGTSGFTSKCTLRHSLVWPVNYGKLVLMVKMKLINKMCVIPVALFSFYWTICTVSSHAFVCINSIVFSCQSGKWSALHYNNIQFKSKFCIHNLLSNQL